MSLRRRTQQIRSFILSSVREHPQDVARLTAQHFGISRQSVHQHLRQMVEERLLVSEGRTRSHVYRPYPTVPWVRDYELDTEEPLHEDTVWRTDIQPMLEHLPENAVHIWLYGFTGIFNNALDHSEARHIQVALHRGPIVTEMVVLDDGVGAFAKIQDALDLVSKRHGAFELAKGKLTTAPDDHTGEDVYFISHLFDNFDICSRDICLYDEIDNAEGWLADKARSARGTAVWMRLDNDTTKDLGTVMDTFTSGREYGFNKTVVPVRLAQHGDAKLVTRARAKRVAIRFENFKTVVLDFQGVESIGPTFADEIFRVFAQRNPGVELVPINTSCEVRRMIERAESWDPNRDGLGSNE